MFCLSSPQQEAGGKYRGIKRYHLPRFQPQRERGPALFRGEADYGVLQSGCGAYGRVNTLRALEEGLENFAGCAVVISHDRWFLDRVATHILSFEGDSQVVFFEGGYSEYEEHKRLLGEDTTPKRVKYRKLME